MAIVVGNRAYQSSDIVGASMGLNGLFGVFELTDYFWPQTLSEPSRLLLDTHRFMVSLSILETLASLELKVSYLQVMVTLLLLSTMKFLSYGLVE